MKVPIKDLKKFTIKKKLKKTIQHHPRKLNNIQGLKLLMEYLFYFLYVI